MGNVAGRFLTVAAAAESVTRESEARVRTVRGRESKMESGVQRRAVNQAPSEARTHRIRCGSYQQEAEQTSRGCSSTASSCDAR